MLDVWLSLFGGLVLLILGGDLLVRGAVQVAGRLGVSPLVIGITLVGFGTSMPELVTSVQAALVDAPGIAYGNIVGSNIANALLIMGASALLCPVAIASAALRRDGLTMVAVAVAFAVIAAAMPMSRAVGAAFILALIAYVYTAFRQERQAAAGQHGAAFDKGAAVQGTDPGTVPEADGQGPISLPLLTAFGGLALVVTGGTLLVDGAVNLAKAFGISETVIGLTVVAVGTSLPEFVTSMVAAYKRQADVAFGNIVGSNIYNVLGIGGATALIAPSTVPADIVSFDNLVMVGVSVLLVSFAWTGMMIRRWEGTVLVAGYAGYVLVTWP